MENALELKNALYAMAYEEILRIFVWQGTTAAHACAITALALFLGRFAALVSHCRLGYYYMRPRLSMH